jgi:hypothetical protein
LFGFFLNHDPIEEHAAAPHTNLRKEVLSVSIGIDFVP